MVLKLGGPGCVSSEAWGRARDESRRDPARESGAPPGSPWDLREANYLISGAFLSFKWDHRSALLSVPRVCPISPSNTVWEGTGEPCWIPALGNGALSPSPATPTHTYTDAHARAQARTHRHTHTIEAHWSREGAYSPEGGDPIHHIRSSIFKSQELQQPACLSPITKTGKLNPREGNTDSNNH